MLRQLKKIVPLSAVLSYLLIAVILTSGVTFARYTTSSVGSDNARVALFVFDVNDKNATMVDALDEITKPGDSETYTFIVTNKSDRGTSEVAEKYTMTFTALGSLPLEYVLTDVKEKKEVYKGKASVEGYTVSGAGETFQAAVESEKEYTLTVTWPENEKGSKYASGSGIASLTIELQADQID